MTPWLEEQFNKLLTSKNKDDFFELLSTTCSSLGFDFCAYALCMPYPLSKPGVIAQTNYPNEWQQRYHQKQYLSIDPTVQHCLGSTTPLTWSDKIFSGSEEMWEEAQAFGIRFGWSQSHHDAQGTISLFGLARDRETLNKSELMHITPYLMWLLQIAHEGFLRFEQDTVSNFTGDPLTPRELEVLRWTADGKTTYEISRILNISERTVNFHANNAIHKLKTNNRTAAAVKAAVLGWL